MSAETLVERAGGLVTITLNRPHRKNAINGQNWVDLEQALDASERARFCAVYAKRGMALDGGASWSLPRTIGLRRAKRMTMYGDEVNAAEALAWGLVNVVVPSDQLIGVADDWGAGFSPDRRLRSASSRGCWRRAPTRASWTRSRVRPAHSIL